MRNVTVGDAAEAELSLIVEYLSFFGASTADDFIDAYESKIESLREGVVEYPLSRHKRLARAGYRVALVKNYIVLYRVVSEDFVFVAHIFHQSQDYARLVTEA